MIGRMVEYYIDCDNKSNCVDGFGNSTAFGSPTQEDCSESAKEYDWEQISKRKWICPQCVTRKVKISTGPPPATPERE